MKRGFGVVWTVIIVLLGACAPSEEVAVIITPPCGIFTLSGSVACQIIADDRQLMQSTTQATVTFANLTVTLNGTLYARIDSNALTLLTLEGLSIVSANQTTRQIASGTQLTMPIDGGQIVGQLGQTVPFDSREILALTPNVPQVVVSLQPQTTDTITKIVATPTTALCAPREDWASTHQVQRGETLSKIAQTYRLTVQEIALGNCLTNPDRIRVGDVLRVPSVSAEQNAPLPANAPTLTPSAVAFRADKNALNSGECTTLRWDVFNVSGVLIDGTPTTSNNLLQVCPVQTTTYTLTVQYPDSTQSTHTVTITLNP